MLFYAYRNIYFCMESIYCYGTVYMIHIIYSTNSTYSIFCQTNRGLWQRLFLADFLTRLKRSGDQTFLSQLKGAHCSSNCAHKKTIQDYRC